MEPLSDSGSAAGDGGILSGASSYRPHKTAAMIMTITSANNSKAIQRDVLDSCVGNRHPREIVVTIITMAIMDSPSHTSCSDFASGGNIGFPRRNHMYQHAIMEMIVKRKLRPVRILNRRREASPRDKPMMTAKKLPTSRAVAWASA